MQLPCNLFDNNIVLWTKLDTSTRPISFMNSISGIIDVIPPLMTTPFAWHPRVVKLSYISDFRNSPHSHIYIMWSFYVIAPNLQFSQTKPSSKVPQFYLFLNFLFRQVPGAGIAWMIVTSAITALLCQDRKHTNTPT